MNQVSVNNCFIEFIIGLRKGGTIRLVLQFDIQGNDLPWGQNEDDLLAFTKCGGKANLFSAGCFA